MGMLAILFGKYLLLFLPIWMLYTGYETKVKPPLIQENERYTIVTEGKTIAYGDIQIKLKTSVGITQNTQFYLIIWDDSITNTFDITKENDYINFGNFYIWAVEMNTGDKNKKPYVKLDIRYVDH